MDDRLLTSLSGFYDEPKLECIALGQYIIWITSKELANYAPPCST